MTNSGTPRCLLRQQPFRRHAKTPTIRSWTMSLILLVGAIGTSKRYGGGVVAAASAAEASSTTLLERLDNRNDANHGGGEESSKTVVYVSSQDGIDVYNFNDDDTTTTTTLFGTMLTRIQSYYPQIAGGADPMAVHPTRQLLYASFRQQEEIHTFDIGVDPSNNNNDGAGGGRLTFLQAAPDFNNSVHLSVVGGGDQLLSAYYGAGAVAVHSLEKNGVLQSAGGGDDQKDARKSKTRVTETAQCAHMVQQVSGGLVLVPHTCDNRIRVFQLGGGALKQVNMVDGGIGTFAFFFTRERGPRHLVEHPVTEGWIYVANEYDSSVTFYTLDSKNGDMTEVYSWSTLPQTLFSFVQDAILQSNSVAAIRITRDGRFLYVSNRGHNSIAAFAVDQNTGRLQNIGVFSTERTPRGFDIAPSGQFLIVAGQDSDRLATYRIGADGRLSLISRTREVGRKPVWVEFVKLL